METALEINGLTGETIIRPLTIDELAQREIDAQLVLELKAEADAKLASRESALAKLAALGLTQDEIDAL